MIRLLFSFLLFIALFNPFTQSWLASQYVVDDGLEPSDVVLALRGDAMEQRIRTDEAATLLAKGYAKTLLLDVNARPYFGETERQMEENYLKQKGLSPQKLQLCENTADSTSEEAVALRSCLKRIGAKSVIVVTSEYHTRRARFILRRIFSDSGITVRVHPVYIPEYWDSHWWRKRRWAKTYFAESEKAMWTLIEDWTGRLKQLPALKVEAN